MGRRVGLVSKSMASALLVSGLMFGGAQAADVALKAPPAPDVLPWWFHGYLEVGGRGFLNDPARGSLPGRGDSLAKYYEYSRIAPGPFADGYLAAGTGDGKYDIAIWAKNVGYLDQRYDVRAEKAGEHYLDFQWDQTPHLYSTSALTLYNGVGTSALTLPPGLSNTLRTASGNTNPIAAPNAAAVNTIINSNVHHTDIGIKRDTASAEYRYTPDSNWDVRANYSNMHRSGTQVDGIVFSAGTSGVTSQVTKPVDDTTQNYGVSGEYVGTSPWDKRFSVRAGYNGSTYTDNLSSYTVQNPFCLTTDVTCARVSAPLALVGLPPSNQANDAVGTISMDLPFESRYVGTISYNMMTQNQPFLPFTINTNPALTFGGLQASNRALLPAQSLNGAINTTLVNNVLTTQLGPDVRSKATYRYYNFDNNTPELLFPNWIVADVATASATTAQYAPVRSLSVSYTKQNAGEEINWRPNKQWNVGGAYGFERYDWTRADVTATNESSGKVFVDWKPVNWVTARASGLYADRQFEGAYNYPGNVGQYQWLTLPAPYNAYVGGSTQSAGAYRQFYLDNRQRAKADFLVGIDVVPGLTVTPTLSLLDDTYQLGAGNEGITHSRSYHTGVEVAYLLGPWTRLFGSYMYENYNQGILSGVPNVAPGTASNNQVYSLNVRDTVNTVMLGVDQTVVPDKLDMKVSYTWSGARDSQPLPFNPFNSPVTGTPITVVGLNYPDTTSQFHRLDAQAKYYFDDNLVRQMGWQGKVTFTLRYAWERNQVNNLQNDMMNVYMYSAANTTIGYMTWLAYDNPNYNVHLIAGSLGFHW
jgi:MtrB/PioB family decaheme-associated outer membrane protein